MFGLNKVSKMFPSFQFNTSPMNDIFITKEQSILWYPKLSLNDNMYNTFNESFVKYLNKLPSGNLKKLVEHVYNLGLVYIGSSQGARNDVVFTRIFLSDDKNYVTAIILDSRILEINSEGVTSNIDNCIYATYFGLLRAAILINKDKIKTDIDLHKLITQYIYRLVLKSLNKGSIFNDKQKIFVLVGCIYLFLRHFIGEKHNIAISNIKRNYSEFASKDIFMEALNAISLNSKYTVMSDLGKLLIDLKVFHGSPNEFMLNLLRNLGNNGIYYFLGSLDQLVGMIVLSNYPTELFSKASFTSDNIHNAIENKMVNYINNVKFKKSMIVDKPGQQ